MGADLLTSNSEFAIPTLLQMKCSPQIHFGKSHMVRGNQERLISLQHMYYVITLRICLRLYHISPILHNMSFIFPSTSQNSSKCNHGTTIFRFRSDASVRIQPCIANRRKFTTQNMYIDSAILFPKALSNRIEASAGAPGGGRCMA